MKELFEKLSAALVASGCPFVLAVAHYNGPADEPWCQCLYGVDDAGFRQAIHVLSAPYGGAHKVLGVPVQAVDDLVDELYPQDLLTVPAYTVNDLLGEAYCQGLFVAMAFASPTGRWQRRLVYGLPSKSGPSLDHCLNDANRDLTVEWNNATHPDNHLAVVTTHTHDAQ